MEEIGVRSTCIPVAMHHVTSGHNNHNTSKLKLVLCLSFATNSVTFTHTVMSIVARHALDVLDVDVVDELAIWLFSR